MTDIELEKKAKEYSQWLYHSKAWNPREDMLVKAYLAGAKEMLKEKEELKEKLEIEQNARIDWFGKAVTKDRQLTEAKEIIRMYYLYNPSNKYSYEEIEQKAETFFKELADENN